MNTTILALVVGGLLALAALFGFQHLTSTPPEPATPVPVVVAAAAQAQDDGIETIEILLGDFYFEGPIGRSGATGKNGAFDGPQVVARLKNRQPVRLVFKNTSNIVIHQVISPLFSMPEETVRVLGPGESFSMEFTPRLRDADDGETVQFNLTCHERHQQATDHYRIGMRALIEVVP